MKRIHFLIAFFAVLSIFNVGCGKEDPIDPVDQEPLVTQVGIPMGALASGNIDATGGTLTSADGLVQLVVPAGAVSAGTPFGLQAISNHSPGGFGNAYRLTPEGISFSQPVSLIFHYSDTAVANENFLDIAFQHSDRTWFSPKIVTLNKHNNTVSVQTRHFSDWTIFERLSIAPVKANVLVSESITFGIVFVNELQTLTDSDGVELNNLNNNTSVSVDWEAAAGTIEKLADDRARFTAPATVPSNNPVDVSVTFSSVNFTLHGTTYSNPTIHAQVNVVEELRYFSVVFTSSRPLQPVGQSWFTETDLGSMKVYNIGDSVIIYDKQNNKAEVQPALLYDPMNECTTTLLDPGDGPYHMPDDIPYAGFYTSLTGQIYIGVGGQIYPSGKVPTFQTACSGNPPDEEGGGLLPSLPAAFSFSADSAFQVQEQVIPGGGAFPDGFYKITVTRIR